MFTGEVLPRQPQLVDMPPSTSMVAKEQKKCDARRAGSHQGRCLGFYLMAFDVEMLVVAIRFGMNLLPGSSNGSVGRPFVLAPQDHATWLALHSAPIHGGSRCLAFTTRLFLICSSNLGTPGNPFEIVHHFQDIHCKTVRIQDAKVK